MEDYVTEEKIKWIHHGKPKRNLENWGLLNVLTSSKTVFLSLQQTKFCDVREQVVRKNQKSFTRNRSIQVWGANLVLTVKRFAINNTKCCSTAFFHLPPTKYSFCSVRKINYLSVSHLWKRCGENLRSPKCKAADLWLHVSYTQFVSWFLQFFFWFYIFCKFHNSSHNP